MIPDRQAYSHHDRLLGSWVQGIDEVALLVVQGVRSGLARRTDGISPIAALQQCCLYLCHPPCFSGEDQGEVFFRSSSRALL